MFSPGLTQATSNKEDSPQKSIKPFDASYVAALPVELQRKIFDQVYPWFQDLTAPVDVSQPEEEKVEKEYSFYQDNRSFFGNVSAQMVAIKAAEYVVMDEPDKAILLIIQFPTIVFEQVGVVDEKGNRLRGDILTIAAMMDAFNPFEMELGEDYGAFEKIAAHYPLVHQEKVKKKVNSPEWDAATKQRMEPIRAAFKTFMEKVISAQATTFDEIKRELGPAILEFQQTLKPTPNEVITAGKVFDLQVIAEAFQHLADMQYKLAFIQAFRYPPHRQNNLDNLWGEKKSVFYVVVGGLLQDQASRFDKRFIRNGIAYTVDDRILPDRTTCAVDRQSFKVNSNFLRPSGVYFLYNVHRPLTLDASSVGSVALYLSKLMSGKKNSSSKKKLTPRRGKQSNRGCTII